MIGYIGAVGNRDIPQGNVGVVVKIVKFKHGFHRHRPSAVRNRPRPLISKLANPDVAPDEFLYHRIAGGRFDPYHCPPILGVTLPHLFADPDAVYTALAPVVQGFARQTRDAHYRQLFALLAQHRGGAAVWVERSGGSLLAVRTLASLFPQAGMVLLLRDGRDVVLSMQGYRPAPLMASLCVICTICLV